MPNRGNIIIINENSIDADFLQELLKNNGYHADKNAGGKKAVENIIKTKPDLVLLGDDLIDINPFSILEDLRKNGQTKYIPVIFFTSPDDTNNRIKGVELCDDLITKPFEARELLARIKRQIIVAGVSMSLQESEAKFRSVLESAIDAIITADDSGIIRLWNRAATDLFGFTEEEAVGRSLELIIPERYRKLHQEGLQRVSSGGPSHVIGDTVEVAALRKNSSEFPVELSLVTWFHEGERYYTGIIRDISERKQAEQKFRSVTESAVDAIISADHTGMIISWNKAATKMLGYTPEEAIGQQLEKIIPKRYHEAHRKGMHRVTSGGESRAIGKTVELFALTKSGAEIPIELSLATWTIREEIYYTGIIRDIRERKQAEETLRKNEEKYRRIVETTGEGFLLMDGSLKIVDLNSAYSKMVGIPRSELIGQYPFARYSHEFNQLLDFEQAKRFCQQDLVIECEVQTRNQGRLPVLIQANGLCSDTGDIRGVMAFVTDLTPQKLALRLAGDVQRSLLPGRAPIVAGLDISGRNIPCDEVGGDYFDFLKNDETDGNGLSIVIGDVSGHGVASALLMASARAFLRMRASQTKEIADVIWDMNRYMTKDVNASGRFMTLFFLVFNNSGKDIEWVRAGHDPAILYDPESDRFEELKGPGLALGVDEGFEYQVQRKKGLTTGQIIVLGTDGIWEGSNLAGEMFGKKRIKNIIRNNASSSAEKILSSIFQEHQQFTKGIKSKDDITGVVIKLVDNYQNFVI